MIKPGQGDDLRLYPDFVEGHSAYEVAGRRVTTRKATRPAPRKQLEQYSQAGGRNPATLIKLAKWQNEARR